MSGSAPVDQAPAPVPVPAPPPVAEVGKKPKGDYTAGEGSGGPYHSKKSKKELRRAINALLGDNKLLYEKVSALEAKRDELMKDGSTLLGLYQNSVAANNGLATTGADLLIESTRLKAELDEAIKARDELQKRLDEAEKKADADLFRARSDASKASTEAEGLRSVLNDLRLENARLSSASREAQSGKVSELEKKIREMSIEITDLRRGEEDSSSSGRGDDEEDPRDTLLNIKRILDEMDTDLDEQIAAGDIMNHILDDEEREEERPILDRVQESVNKARGLDAALSDVDILQGTLDVVVRSYVDLVKAILSDAHTENVSDPRALQDFFTVAYFATDIQTVKDRLRRSRSDGTFEALREKVLAAAKKRVDELGPHVDDAKNIQIVSALCDLDTEDDSEELDAFLRAAIKCVWGRATVAPTAPPPPPAPSPSSGKRPASSPPTPPTPPSSGRSSRGGGGGGGGSSSSSGSTVVNRGLRFLKPCANVLVCTLIVPLSKQGVDYSNRPARETMRSEIPSFYTIMNPDAPNGGLDPATSKLDRFGTTRPRTQGLFTDVTDWFLCFADRVTDKTFAGFGELLAAVGPGAANLKDISIPDSLNRHNFEAVRSNFLAKLNAYLRKEGGKTVSEADAKKIANQLVPYGQDLKREWSILLVGKQTGVAHPIARKHYDTPASPGLWLALLPGGVTTIE